MVERKEKENRKKKKKQGKANLVMYVKLVWLESLGGEKSCSVDWMTAKHSDERTSPEKVAHLRYLK